MSKRSAGGLAPADFLRRYWHKRPLLTRQALPEYAEFLTREDLFDLAKRDDVQSRLVMRTRGRWHVEHGPFSRRRLSQLPRSNWTLLVQGVNHVMPAAQTLLQEFSFIPHARLDDLMVSFAPPGGGVGPHFDSYDVFLLQLRGERRWQISRQRDLELVDGAPLKLLRRFRAQREWTLAPGDMLYLPPEAAHDGTAVSPCLTASIGFRAPTAQELGSRFLEYLQDELALEGRYADPDLAAHAHPAEIGAGMVKKVRHTLEQIRWDDADVLKFLGRYLTEPKPHVMFERPPRPLPLSRFALRARRCGLRLALPTLMLFRGRTIFINGEECAVEPGAARLLARLADERRLAPPLSLSAQHLRWLYPWYRAGYIEPDNANDAAAAKAAKVR